MKQKTLGAVLMDKLMSFWGRNNKANHEYLVYRDLYDQIIHFEGEKENVYGGIIKPWLKNTQSERDWIKEYSLLSPESWPDEKAEDLWRLYALSRVNGLLLLRFQGGAGKKFVVKIGLDEYREIIESMGLSIATHSKFNPFFHEIVEVVPSSDIEREIGVERVIWPAVMMGNLLISRAGCVVRGGANLINKQVAEKSTLYWSHRHNGRPNADLSHGWGSNSQWRTSFRRDYKIGNKYYFNVDAKYDVNGSLRKNKKEIYMGFNDSGLSFEERVELLTNRCFIRTEKNSVDLFPYDWFYSSDETGLEKRRARKI